MNRDEDSLGARRRPPDEERDLSDPWVTPASSRRARRGRPVTSQYPAYVPPTRSAPKAPLKVAPTMLPGPSYPVWERPVSRQEFPKLRGREEHRPMWPFIVAALAIAVTLTAIGVLEAVGTHMGSVAAVSHSPVPSVSKVVPSFTASPTHTQAGTPGPSVTCRSHHKVVYGDRWYRIAADNGLSPSELSAANPQITNPGNLHPGDDLCIPWPAGVTPPPAPTPTPTEAEASPS